MPCPAQLRLEATFTLYNSLHVMKRNKALTCRHRTAFFDKKIVICIWTTNERSKTKPCLGQGHVHVRIDERVRSKAKKAKESG